MLEKSHSLNRLAIVALCGMAGLSPQLSYACELNAGSSPISPQIDYDVFAFERAISSTEFDLNNTGDTECKIEIVVEDLGDLPPPFNFVDAGVAIDVTAPGLQRPISDQIIEGIFALTLTPGSSHTVQLDFFTNQFAAVPAGAYERDISIGVRLENSSQLLEEFVTNLSLVAQSRAQVNIAGTAGNFDANTFNEFIDFGEPEVGESQRVFVQARSNALATMTIRSDNKGLLKHDTAENASIGYQAVLDGTELDLSSDVVLSGLSATDLNGVSRPLDITLVEITNPFAGLYTDRIVVEIETR